MAGPAEFGRRQNAARPTAAQQEQGWRRRLRPGRGSRQPGFALARRRQGRAASWTGAWSKRSPCTTLAVAAQAACGDARQAQQGIGCRQPVEITTRQPGPGGGSATSAKGRHGGRPQSARPASPGKPFDLAQAEANASRRRQGAFPITGCRVRRQHGNAMPPGILDQQGSRIETHGLAVEQAAQENIRMMALDPGRGVDQQCETGSM